MGFLFNAFEFVFAGGCLLGLNFILMFLFGLLRNFPAILDAARQALKEILKISYWAYRPIITRLQPVMHRYLGIQIEKTPVRILATSLLSLLLLLGFNLVLGWSVSIFFIVLAILHGAVTGLLWDDLDHADDLRMGEKIQ